MNQAKSDPVTTLLNKIPAWALLSLATNGLLMLTVSLLLTRSPIASVDLQTSDDLQRGGLTSSVNAVEQPLPQEKTELGPRHQWNYQQWVNQLQREAAATAENKPERLAVLAGDSISLWFPPELLPPGKTWLNQGISGETSSGLLKRLKLFDNTEPDTVFVMIGINDLIRGISPEIILENSRLIIKDMRWVHPNAQIVVQSILPHSGEGATWEGRDRLLKVSNETIRQINQQLEAIAQEESVYYLNLHPLFTDENGYLRLDLTTDGLHLNHQGYLVWRSALQLYSQLKLEGNRVNQSE